MVSAESGLLSGLSHMADHILSIRLSSNRKMEHVHRLMNQNQGMLWKH